jgi:hypothetical protein
MPRIPQSLPPLRDQIPCPLRATIGIALGMATAVGITRAILWLVALWTPVEIREDLSLPLLLLTGVVFVAVLGVMGSIVQRNTPLSQFVGWCTDDPD